jgi:hypothetical protein
MMRIDENRPGSRHTSSAVALLAFALWTPASLTAQAICSAPHSSPTLAQSGSLRTLPPGAGWAGVSLFGQRATRFFTADGDRQSFLAESEFHTYSVFVSAAVGVTHGLELWAQLPTHRLQVQSQGGDSRRAGVGDARIAVRIGPEILGYDFPVSVRLATKLPGSEFPVDATVLPLSEGQRDWEVSLESGHWFQDRSLYLMGWVGYRWREENSDALRDPGDEAFGHLAVGGSVGDFSWEVSGDGLWGWAPVIQGLLLENNARRLVQILPTASWALGPGRMEATGQIPVAGRSLPVGYALSIGYRLTWGLTTDPTATLVDLVSTAAAAPGGPPSPPGNGASRL